jgi:hypothetical protein
MSDEKCACDTWRKVMCLLHFDGLTEAERRSVAVAVGVRDQSFAVIPPRRTNSQR